MFTNIHEISKSAILLERTEGERGLLKSYAKCEFSYKGADPMWCDFQVFASLMAIHAGDDKGAQEIMSAYDRATLIQAWRNNKMKWATKPMPMEQQFETLVDIFREKAKAVPAIKDYLVNMAKANYREFFEISKYDNTMGGVVRPDGKFYGYNLRGLAWARVQQELMPTTTVDSKSVEKLKAIFGGKSLDTQKEQPSRGRKKKDETPA